MDSKGHDRRRDEGSDNRTKDAYGIPLAIIDMSVMDALDDQFEQISYDGASSSVSVDGLSSETLSLSLGDIPSEHGHGDDGTSSTDGSSPLGWPIRRPEKCRPGMPPILSKATFGSLGAVWEEKREKRETDISEVEMMKEKFAKLLLGEDMSGCGKGVCTALAISNAITNLSASVFGELWRLEPLPVERKTMWRREMEWLLSVADHIVELVPSWQTFPDGSSFEVMISRPRSDLIVNLPALRKLDAMLLDSLDSFCETEFWYADQGIAVAEEDGHNIQRPQLQRQEEKWWLPTPKVPVNGLSAEGRKRLQHQRECINQILKAALAINSQVLSEMEIPDVYWDALPKNGKTSLGESIYRHFTTEYFSAEALLCTLDLSTEHKAVEVANRIEAAIHVWRRRRQAKHTQKLTNDSRQSAKNSWGIVKDIVSDTDRREFLAGRAESLLLCLKQKFPGLRQSLLDTTKIQYNKDIGQSILESYSRVMESLAFNIIGRIDDVLYVDDLTKGALPPPPSAVKTRMTSSQRRGFFLNLSVNTPYVTPIATPSLSPTPSSSPRGTPNSPFHPGENARGLSDYINLSYGFEKEENNESQGHKKPPLLQQSISWVPVKTLNSTKAQLVHPVPE